ncbi:hypothetical protein FTO70_05095 [Methanosarcina sp. KYL-1]|uniref:hypothetical protein n=1 Tax=Methanosarcina sp. KYL-1 TaxID=2602068 RepID=UPI002100760A|nr:hypothetical protein [Methanosarcina sp. KYL-1]MCQ1535073.1 hypothetical protein [Methanosarcina sp. KYL-1]
MFSRPFTLSDFSLLDQILAFAILVYALYRKKKSISLHGKIATIAFFLTVPSVLYMLYSASIGLTLPSYQAVLTLHRLMGTLTILLGIIFVTNRWKWKGKKYMDLGILCWAGTFLMGIGVYLLLFGFIS